MRSRQTPGGEAGGLGGEGAGSEELGAGSKTKKQKQKKKKSGRRSFIDAQSIQSGRGGGGTYLMLLASATAVGKEEVEEESFMDFVGMSRTNPGTQPSAAGDWLSACR